MSAQSSQPFVPVPFAVLNDLLPTLTGAQLKVLLVVVRQTAGWRKPCDWMTQAYLKQATGLASAAVSGAIDALVQRGVISVTDGQGKALVSAAERRRTGRLFFMLGASPSSPDSSYSLFEVGYPHFYSKSELRKTKTTKHTHYNKSRNVWNTLAYRPITRASTAIQPIIVHGPSASHVTAAMDRVAH